MPSNQQLATSKILEIFGNQKSTDYLLSITNMMKYKNSCQYFYRYFVLIACDFSINKFKNIFNITLFQFLEDDKEYNQKTAYKTFDNNNDWVIDKLIKCIYGYTKLWIVSFSGIDYKKKYLYVK